MCEQGWLDVVNALTHPPWSWSLTPAFLRGAVRGKHVALVEYLMENRCIYDPWEAIDNAIAPRDFPFFIQMSKLLGFNSFGARITVRAIEEGVVDILKVLYTSPTPPPDGCSGVSKEERPCPPSRFML